MSFFLWLPFSIVFYFPILVLFSVYSSQSLFIHLFKSFGVLLWVCVNCVFLPLAFFYCFFKPFFIIIQCLFFLFTVYSFIQVFLCRLVVEYRLCVFSLASLYCCFLSSLLYSCSISLYSFIRVFQLSIPPSCLPLSSPYSSPYSVYSFTQAFLLSSYE